MTTTATHAPQWSAEDRLHQLRVVHERLLSKPNEPDAIMQALEVILADRIDDLAEQLRDLD